MTDNSNAAPERIWAWPNDVEDGFMAASRVNEPPTLEYGDGSHVEYIRADLASAQVAAAYEAAALLAAEYPASTHGCLSSDPFEAAEMAAEEIAAAIRALAQEEE